MRNGYTRAQLEWIPRLLLSLDGDEGTGKTTFALTAPGPLVYMDFNGGGDGIIQTVQDEKEILLPGDGEPYILPDLLGDTPEAVRDAAAPVKRRFVQDFIAACDDPNIRSVVVDTGTEANQVFRLSSMGKIGKAEGDTGAKIAQQEIVNSEWLTLLRHATHRTTANVILIHHLKEKWSGGKPTGEYVRSGWGHMGKNVHAELIAERSSEGVYSLRFGKCRQNSSLNYSQDVVFRSDDMPLTFGLVGQAVFSMTDAEDWE
uniref:Putative ATPase domain containing protein n=1 Tax=viral metagenome TaxID=1070528 RepID=A0A6M3LHJ6_9ZZZZ